MSTQNGVKCSRTRIVVLFTLLGCLSLKTLRYSSMEVYDIFKSRSLNLFEHKHEVKNPNMDDNKPSAGHIISVPADMWKNPRGVPSWQPVKLPNCCPGRHKKGRHLLVSRFTDKIMGRCRNRKTVRYIGPGNGLTNIDLRMALQKYKGDFIMIGDSLYRQWFEQLACYLGAWSNWQGFAKVPVEMNRLEFETDITEALIKFRPKWAERGHLGIGGKSYSRFGHFDIPRETNDAVDQRVISHAIYTFTKEEILDLLLFYDSVYPREFSRERPVFIINKGIHYNHFRTEGTASPTALYENLKLLMKTCVDFGMRCIFTESTPQHFENSQGNGLFRSYTYNKCMKKPPESFNTLDRWRNDVLYRVAGEVLSNKDQEGDGFVKIMPLFDKLAYLSFAHGGKPPRQDCTHYTPDPEYWEPWHVSLTQILQETFEYEKLA